jgi:hypothetical protein
LGCTDPQRMLGFLKGKASDRKLRLFAVACCRNAWMLLENELSRQAVEVAERFADGSADLIELRQAHELAEGVLNESVDRGLVLEETAFPVVATLDSSWEAAYDLTFSYQDIDGLREKKEHAALLRDIFGNPFRPITIDPAWLTPSVKALAQRIYDDRAFDPMPILADEMEKAGCDNATFLSHCRGPEPHVRGCWVIDLLLGKE